MLEMDGILESVKQSGWRELVEGERWTPSIDSLTSSPFSLPKGESDLSPADIFEMLMPAPAVYAISSELPMVTTGVGEAYTFFGFRILLTVGNYHERFRGNYSVLNKSVAHVRQLVFERLRLNRSNKGSNIPGCSKFYTWMKHGRITPNIASGPMAEATLAMITLGKFISVNERYHVCNSRTPFSKRTRSKTKNNGRWVSQVATVMGGSELPIMIGILTQDIGSDAPKGGFMDATLRWFSSLKGEKSTDSVVCIDKHHNSGNIRQYCKEAGLKYAAAVDRKWEKDLYFVLSYLKPSIRRWHGLYNDSTGESVILVDKGQGEEGYSMVIGNVLQPHRVAPSSTDDPPISHEYPPMFDAFDLFNRRLAGIWWPFNRQGSEGHLDTLYFSTLLINTYHIWLSLDAGNRGKFLRHQDFFRELGWELLERYAIAAHKLPRG